MSQLKNLLYSYVYNPTNENRLDLADEYYRLEQYAAALSYYLQTAEMSPDKDMQYYSLIQCGKCFQVPGNRKHSVMTLYKHAIHLLPERPEAYYYLSKVYEWHNEWFDCYTFAHLGLEKPQVDDIYTNKLAYNGKVMILFQKALSAWWIGKGDESRDLHTEMISKYFHTMDETLLNTMLGNLRILYKQ